MANEFDQKQYSFRAWTEEIEPGKALQLHVHGELQVEDETLLYQLDKRDQQGYYSEELFLVIKPDPKPGNNKITLVYHENLENEHRYEKITILSKTQQVFEIKEIEKKR